MHTPETILLTFLGTGNYQSCRYRFGKDLAQEETFFSVALAQQLEPTPSNVLRFSTTAAENKHGKTLDARFGELGIPCQSVPIPNGHSEQEIWKIFSELTNHVPQGCHLHLDITHGFRSLPLLGFLALSYLRVTRQVEIGGIYYGAWEARDTKTNLAPVFDLTPFLTLLDWTAAAEDFLATGTTSRLAALLRQNQNTAWRSAAQADKETLPRQLQPLATALETASTDLRFLRTGHLSTSAAALRRALDSSKSDAAKHARPFLELLDPVAAELTAFADSDLATLRQLITWLARKGHPDAALTLASEWLTSYAMEWCRQPSADTSHETRSPYSLALRLIEPNADPNEIRGANRERILELHDQLRNRLAAHQGLEQSLAKISANVRLLRNDLNHAGYTKQPLQATKLREDATNLASEINTLPLP